MLFIVFLILSCFLLKNKFNDGFPGNLFPENLYIWMKYNAQRHRYDED
jgi:hypothetical protein